MSTSWKTITLETAKRAVKAYNDGKYGCLKNPDLDQQALDMFADGLGIAGGKVLRQVEFIGRNYGGVAGYPSAIKLSEDIANDILKNRETFEQAAYSAPSLLVEAPCMSTIEILYRPFVKPLDGKSNWQVWATKFWHFLNPNAFPIEDSRVDRFFLFNQPNSVEKYLRLSSKFREFALSHDEWLPQLREVDGGYAWCDNKLWDKMCYGLVDLESL